MLPEILPSVDEELAAEARKNLQKQGVKFALNTKVESVSVKNGKATVKVSENGATKEFSSRTGFSGCRFYTEFADTRIGKYRCEDRPARFH
ncbi:MAG: NAD-binding protein [Flexilinea sp.]